jgi:hypothetical protein
MKGVWNLAATKTRKSISKAFDNAPIITEADIRRAIFEAHGTLTDKQVFTSSAYHRKMNTFARYLTGRTGRGGTDIAVSARVVWNEKDKDMTAYTDGITAVINAACEDIHKTYKQRIDKHYAVMGLAVHEFAHCLFTDFRLCKAQHDAFMEGAMYPAEPPVTPTNEAGIIGLKKILSKGKGACNAMFKMFKNLDNSIEDVYVEKSLSQLFPGDAKRALRYSNKAFFGGDFMDVVRSMYSSGRYVSKWALFGNAMITMLMMKTINLDTAFSSDVADIATRLNKLLPRLQRETENASHIARKQLCLDIILENWDLIEEDIKHGLSMDDATEIILDLSDMTAEEAAAILEGIFGQMNNTAGADHDRENDPNRGAPIRVFIELPPDVSLPDMGSSADDDANVEVVISGRKQDEDSERNGKSGGGSSSSPENESDEGNAGGAQGKDSNDTDGQPGDSSQPKSPAGDSGDDGEKNAESSGGDEKGNGEAADENAVGGSAGSGNDQVSSSNKEETVTIEFGEDEGDDASGGGNSLTKDLSEVEDGLSKDAAAQVIESKLQEILQNNANGSKATSEHWNILINRAAATSEGATRYESVWPKLRNVSKALKKELLKILTERRTGSRQTGLPFGRRINSRGLSRQDEKFFVKNKSPDNSPRVAAVLLIDRSGSMHSAAYDSSNQGLFGNKIQAASNAALVLYDFCVDLDFPVMVCSHYTGNAVNTVMIDSMAAFQKSGKHDMTDRYRIAGATAGGGNRDGTALNYALSELKMRPEDIKLLFIISDGLPSDYDSGEDGVLHLQEVMDDARRSGVFVFAAALDEDIPALRHIYGDGMFEMTDLAKMPKTLLNVMRRYLK